MTSRRTTRTTMMLLGTVACLLSTSVSVASADTLTVADADDSSGRLDLASITQDHLVVTRKQTFLEHRFSMYEEWDNDVLDNTDRVPGSMIEIRFSIDDDHRFERYLRIGLTEDGALSAVVVADRERKPDYVRGYAYISRPDARSVRVVFPPNLLKKNLEVYQWDVVTQYDDDEACPPTDDVSGPCVDIAPSEPVEHRIR